MSLMTRLLSRRRSAAAISGAPPRSFTRSAATPIPMRLLRMSCRTIRRSSTWTTSTRFDRWEW